MSSLFSKILAGELPGRFVWSDPDVAAFLTIAPLAAGHTLVVPRQEVDRFTDLDPDRFGSLMRVAQILGQGIQRAWQPPRVGLIVAGFEVAHVHVHVFPAWSMATFDFDSADPDPDPADLDAAADRLRTALRELGHAEADSPS